MCRAFGQRPSTVLGITNPELALDFDFAINFIHRAERDSRVTEAAKDDVWTGILMAALLGD